MFALLRHFHISIFCNNARRVINGCVSGDIASYTHTVLHLKWSSQITVQYVTSGGNSNLQLYCMTITKKTSTGTVISFTLPRTVDPRTWHTH
jgi:hypothetical protein